jgi:hypothetical protein
MRRMERSLRMYVAFLGGAASTLPDFGDRQVPGPDSADGQGAAAVPGMFPALALDLRPGAFDEGRAAGGGSTARERQSPRESSQQ